MSNIETSTLFSDMFTKEEMSASRFRSIFSAAIIAKRAALNKSQKEFAELLGVTQGQISKWESGEYNFSVDKLNEIACKLGEKPESFYFSNLTTKYKIYMTPFSEYTYTFRFNNRPFSSFSKTNMTSIRQFDKRNCDEYVEYKEAHGA